MDLRNLGSTGTIVSELALGTMTFGAEADEETSHRILERYLDAGGNLVDTADVYGSGTSETIIGRWLARNPGRRDDVVLATKGRFPMGAGPNDLGLSRTHLRRALEASLRRLGVDHVDLYQLHAWDALTPLEETLRFLDDAVRAGSISYYGFSNYLGWQLTKAVQLARANGWAPPVTLQPQYNLLLRGIEHEIVPAALDAGIGLLPWSPLAGGWLSGKYHRDEPPTGATRLGENPERGMEAWDARNADPHTWQVVDALERVAAEAGTTPVRAALAWLVDRPAVTSVILGVRTVEQLEENLGAAEVELTEAQRATLEEASRPRVEVYPYGEAAVQQRYRRREGGR